MGFPRAMSAAALSGDSVRGSASARVIARYSSSRAIVLESAIATTIIGLPSSLFPSSKSRRRGDAASSARRYRVMSATYDSRPTVPGT